MDPCTIFKSYTAIMSNYIMLYRFVQRTRYLLGRCLF